MLLMTGLARADVGRPVRSCMPELTNTPKHHFKVPFGPNSAANTAFAMDERFRSWPVLNDEAVAASVGVGRRSRLDPRQNRLAELFVGDGLQARLGRALTARRAVDRKEFFETFEFFAQVRSSLRVSPTTSDAGTGTLVDVAGGHGLLALLFAVFERRRFTRVIVVDTMRPPAFDKVLEAGLEVAPWVQVEYICGTSADMLAQGMGAHHIPTGAAVACVHGCNTLTDAVIDATAAADCESLAVMPCCYAAVAKKAGAPRALRKSLGVALAADVQRTYTLENLGYDVKWKAIPASITPLNRVLIARRRRDVAVHTSMGQEVDLEAL